jgi:hypothetical protein
MENKKRILNNAREISQCTHKGKSTKIIADFSKETLQPRRTYNDVLQTQKENDCEPRCLYPPSKSNLHN